MATKADGLSRLDAKRREQTPQALARLVVVALFVSLWLLLWLARMPMPLPFLVVLLAEIGFFLVYWRAVFVLRSVRAVEIAHYVMLAAEIVFHTTMVYFLGGISWLGAFAYVFGLIFTNTFLDLRRGMAYTTGASLAFAALILLDATGTIPHYVYLEQGALRYSDPTVVATTLVGASGVFFSIYLWVNWVGHQLRIERDTAVRAQDSLLHARAELERLNEALEERVRARTSELEHTNTALKESEERFRRLSENAPDVIYRYRLQPTFACEYMSPASLAITGYSPAEYYVEPMLGLTIVHPEDREQLQGAFLGGADEPLTVRCIRKDGELIWCEQRFVAIYDRDGNVTAVEGISRDTTARRHAEEALRESEQRLNLVVETSPDLIAIQARNGRYTFVNSAYRAVLGYEPDELVGLNPADLIHVDDLEEVSKRFNDMVQSGRAGEATVRFRHRDGHWVTLEANGQVLIDDAGQATGVVVVSRDVTERVRAAAALRESEERQRTLIEGAGAILWEADAVTWRFTFVSRQAEVILGYPVEQWYEPGFWVDHIHPDDRESAAGFCMQATAEGRDHEFDYRMLAQDGRAVWLHDVVRVVQDEHGTARQLRGIMLDITQRKAMEEALRQSEEVLRATIESTADGIVVFDNHGSMLHFNSQFAGMWGLPEHLLETRNGRAMSDVVQDQLEDPEGFMSSTRRVYATSDESSDVLVFKDGRVFDRFSRPLFQGDQPVGRVWSFRDVTERLRAEEALRESEERFRRLAENAADIIFRYRLLPAPGYEYVSPAVTSVLGYSPDEVYADSGLGPAIVHPDDLEGLSRLSEASADAPLVLRFYHRNGSLVWLEFRTVPTRGDEGELVAIEGIARDITERKRAEHILRETEERFRKIFEDGPLGMAIAGADFKLVRANSTFCRMFGYSEQELAEMTFAEITHPEDVDKTIELAQQLFAGAIPSYKLEKRYIRKDGATVWATLTASVIRSEDGTALYSIGMVEDITDRRRQEEALRESESKFRTMAETVAAAAFIFQGDKMRYVNSAAEAITGYSREDLLDMNFWDVIHPNDRDLVRERGLARQRGDHTPVRYEVQIATRNGADRWVDFTAGMIEFDGAPAVLGTAFDVTERKRAEDALREQARRDPLTGLLNHAAIVDELRELIDAGEPATTHAVAMVDVDGLKAVNDTFGHQIGDLVLLTVARALTREGAVVGRYGGDEFVALLNGRDRAGAERYRDAVVEAVTGARVKDPETGATVPVVVSMGLAIYPEEAESIEELIKLSDSAMYAWRRHRPIVAGESRPSGPLPGARAAEMIGELVPLLTSPGDLSDKFRAVAHRISAGAGYDAVNFALFADQPGAPLAASTFARVADDLVEAWNDDQRADVEDPHPIRVLFEQNPLPVIMDDPWNDQRLLESQRALLRAAELHSVLVAPMLWHGDVVGSLGVASQQEHAFTSRDAQFLAAVATQVTAIVRMANLVEELQSSAARLSEAQTETVLLLASVAEARDQTTGRHLQHVRALTETLARELDYDEDAARELGLAAVLHDIGKIRVPDAVLGNTGSLRPDEWELVKQHTVWGAELLSGRPGFELAATIARSHHERWDGTGYPGGLAGGTLPEAACIVAVADAFDAIVDSRPYSKGRSVAYAVREIADCAGKQFSPQVVDALLRLYEENRLPTTTTHSRRAA